MTASLPGFQNALRLTEHCSALRACEWCGIPGSCLTRIHQEGTCAYYHSSCVKEARLFLLDMLNICSRPEQTTQSRIEEFVVPEIQFLAPKIGGI